VTDGLGDLNYNKIIHERSRLLILTKLASSPAKKLSFSDLKDTLGFTAGNLSIHLKQLEEAGYIRLEKRFENNKPLTTVCAEDAGIQALEEYLNDMEKLIKSLKNKGDQNV
jgi:DNA-binding MarR family transcriptional regulator